MPVREMIEAIAGARCPPAADLTTALKLKSDDDALGHPRGTRGDAGAPTTKGFGGVASEPSNARRRGLRRRQTYCTNNCTIIVRTADSGMGHCTGEYFRFDSRDLNGIATNIESLSNRVEL